MAFRDKLPDVNSNKIPADLRGIMLQSQPFVVSDVYQDFNDLLATKRGQNESFKNFESRFEAQVSKFNSHADSSKLPDAITAFMLLANSSVDSSQRISVLASTSPNDTILTEAATTGDYISSISCGSVASVLRQCDKTKNTPLEMKNSLCADYATAPSRYTKRSTLTPEQLLDLKSRSTCRKCQNVGHWAVDHNPDGTLKPNVKSESPDLASHPTEKKTVKFNMVNVHKGDTIPASFF